MYRGKSNFSVPLVRNLLVLPIGKNQWIPTTLFDDFDAIAFLQYVSPNRGESGFLERAVSQLRCRGFRIFEHILNIFDSVKNRVLHLWVPGRFFLSQFFTHFLMFSRVPRCLSALHGTEARFYRSLVVMCDYVGSCALFIRQVALALALERGGMGDL